MRNKIIVIFLFSVLVLINAIVIVKSFNNTPVGSISSDAFAYTATTTDFTWANNQTNYVLKTGQGSLGSIVIGNATAVGTLYLYDATTTAAHANHATTTLAVINVGALSGTYIYDVAFTRGLVAVMSSTFATSTITLK